MIKKYGNYNTILNENEVVISIKTTGINHRINKIFMITIFSGEKSKNIIQLLSENKHDESEIIDTAYEIIMTKQMITYNGNSFDKKFLQNDIYSEQQLNIFEIKRFLKSSVYFDLPSLKLHDVLTRLKINTNNIISEKQLISIYKEYLNDENNSKIEQILSCGLDSCYYRYYLYLIIKDTIKKNQFTINLLNNEIDIFLYKKIIKGDFIYFYYYTLTTCPPIDLVNFNVQLFTDNNFLVVRFQYSKGLIDPLRIGSSVITTLKVNQNIKLKKDHILIAIEDKFDYAVINKLVKLLTAKQG